MVVDLKKLRELCEEIVGNAIIGPTVSWFEAAPDQAGNTLRFVYFTQYGREVKQEGAGPSPGNEPRAFDAAVDAFLAGFSSIFRDKRKTGEGLVWRVVPDFVSADGKLGYIRARYVFAPECDIVFPEHMNGTPAHVAHFDGAKEISHPQAHEVFPAKIGRIDRIMRY